LPTLVDDEDLVELLVDALAGLVERDERRHLVDVGEDAQRLGVVESGRGVETASRVVPRGDARPGRHHLGDRDALALAARDAAHEGVADLGVARVRDAEHAQEELHDLLVELLLGLAGEELARRLDAQGEEERLGDRERRRMVVVLLVVDDLAAVALGHLVGGDAAVRDVAVDGHVAVTLVGDRLEERRAAVSEEGEVRQMLLLCGREGR